MKNQFKNLILAMILVAASTLVDAQSTSSLWTNTTNGNTATNAYRLGTNNGFDLKVVTNGTIRMTVKKITGRVGIGTTAPANPVNQLEVDVTNPEDGIKVIQNGGPNGNGAASLHLKNNTAGGKMWTIHSLGSGNTNQGSGNFLIEEADDYMLNNVDRFLIQKGTGYVGIGTSSPNDKLEINSGLTSRSGLRFTQLTATTPTNATPNDFNCRKVLSVDVTGEVILIDLDSCGHASNRPAQEEQFANQQAQIDDLKNQIAELKAMMTGNSNTAEKASEASKAISIQIVPNPLSQEATVSYSLPEHAINAQLNITDISGKVLKTYLLAPGSVKQVINVNEFKAGSYLCSIVVNGKQVESKQMVIAK